MGTFVPLLGNSPHLTMDRGRTAGRAETVVMVKAEARVVMDRVAQGSDRQGGKG